MKTYIESPAESGKPDIKRLKELAGKLKGMQLKADIGNYAIADTGDYDGYVTLCAELDGERQRRLDFYAAHGDEDELDDMARLIAELFNNAPALIAAYETLHGIANANPADWDEEVRDQFQEWAQSRARAAMGDKP